MLKNGHDHSGHRTLELALSQESIDGLIWFFAAVTNSGEVKSYYNNFYVEKISIGRGHLGKTRLKIAVSQEWNGELGRLFAC